MIRSLFHKTFVVCLAFASTAAIAADGKSSLADSAVVKGLGILGSNQASDNILPATHEPKMLKDAEIQPELGKKLPLGTEWTDHTGKQVTLGDYFKNEIPTIVTLGYYKCPMLCDLVLNALVDGLKGVGLDLGKDFQIVTMSISPEEGTELAAKKRGSYLRSLGYTEKSQGWAFHTGTQESIDTVTKSLGFGFNKDAESGEYAHAAGIYIATPDGILNNVLFGLMYEAKDLRFALLEAGKGKIGQLLDRIVLSCFQYNAEVGTYTVYVWGLMRLAAILTVLLLMLTFFVMKKNERKPANAT
ncbi:MAG: hypothetical protein CMH56_04485 [Myxococcales bacterium]|nr:hypothetical protein [Myxococcales bacterium]|tara:strand:- start:2018 stop:2920 length:903 start_codon:yes stop_codon:yes gene_type:complete